MQHTGVLKSDLFLPTILLWYHGGEMNHGFWLMAATPRLDFVEGINVCSHLIVSFAWAFSYVCSFWLSGDWAQRQSKVGHLTNKQHL